MTITAAHRRARDQSPITPAIVRVAAYCRRSVEKAELQFGSIEAQREAIAGYVTSRQALGWTLLPAHYDDRGISGATLERPDFQRLMRDVDAGLVDVIAVYKFDRLSRNFVDFVQLIQRLEHQHIGVVSTTESIDTSTDIGRLLLNVMASFAEFSRKQGAERVRHKMLAARLRGQWQGGRVSLGYDSVDKRLVVNAAEAADVVAIFQTFARTRSLVGTLRELERRGIRNKSWTGKRGQRVKGTGFTKNSLTHLLTNVLYAGKMRAGKEEVDGDHDVIVPAALWDEVQAIFAEGKVAPGRPERQAWSGLLTGILKCAACGSSMVPNYSTKGTKRYGYYTCQRQKSHGAAACPGSRVPQDVVEAAVVERLMAIGRDPSLVAEAVQAAHAEITSRRAELAQDARRFGTEVHRLKAERDELVAATVRDGGADVRSKLDAVRDALSEAQARAAAVRDELAALKASDLDEDALRRAIESFTPVWAELFPAERERLIRLLVDRVSIDAGTGDMAIAFHASGIAELASQGAVA
jgi:site-specific DNA recombinase